MSSLRSGRFLVAALFVSNITSAGPSFGEAFSESTEGRWFAGFLNTFNVGDVESITQLADSTGHDAAYLYSLYQEFGPLGQGREYMGAYWFRGEITKGWVGLELAPAEDGFHVCGVRRGLIPENAPRSEPLRSSGLSSYLHGYLGASAAGGHFSGAVLVSKDGDVLFEEAYGFADRSGRVANTVDTQFNLASVTKTFIGVAITQLAQRGRLSFDDPISRFIPEYPERIAEQVTVHHLLTHTSGIELDDYPPYNEAVAEAASLEELIAAQIRFIEHLNRGNYETFEPLGRFDYTNEGIDLLGMVIERSSGKDWRSYLSENVFAPAGMTRTGILDAHTQVPGLAKGYSLRSESLDGFILGPRREVDTARILSRAARPAGSGYSTVGDMLRFVNALRDGCLIDREHFRLVTSPQVDAISIGSFHRAYGYTFEVDRQDGVLTVGHSGGAPGISTTLEIFPESGYTVVVLSNFDRSSARNVSAHVKELIGR